MSSIGRHEVDPAAEQPLSLRERVETDVAGEPIARVVATATSYGYARKDGVAVVPMGALTL